VQVRQIFIGRVGDDEPHRGAVFQLALAQRQRRGALFKVDMRRLQHDNRAQKLGLDFRR